MCIVTPSMRSSALSPVSFRAEAMALTAKAGRIAIFGGRLVLESEVPDCGIARFDIQARVSMEQIDAAIEFSRLQAVVHTRLCPPKSQTQAHAQS